MRALFPGCPAGRETVIAEHACQKYSGRVGRSASAKQLDEAAVRLAVIAHIRHAETGYDRLLADGTDRSAARAAVSADIERCWLRGPRGGNLRCGWRSRLEGAGLSTGYVVWGGGWERGEGR